MFEWCSLCSAMAVDQPMDQDAMLFHVLTRHHNTAMLKGTNARHMPAKLMHLRIALLFEHGSLTPSAGSIALVLVLDLLLALPLA